MPHATSDGRSSRLCLRGRPSKIRSSPPWPNSPRRRRHGSRRHRRRRHHCRRHRRRSMLGLAPAASTSSVSRSTACLLLCKGPPCSSPKTAPCQLPCAAAHRSADVHLVRLPCPAVCVCCGQAKRRKLEGLLESICGVITADDLMCTAAPGGQPPPRHLEPYLCPPTAFAFALPLPLPSHCPCPFRCQAATTPQSLPAGVQSVSRTQDPTQLSFGSSSESRRQLETRKD